MQLHRTFLDDSGQQQRPGLSTHEKHQASISEHCTFAPIAWHACMLAGGSVYVRMHACVYNVYIRG